MYLRYLGVVLVVAVAFQNCSKPKSADQSSASSVAGPLGTIGANLGAGASDQVPVSPPVTTNANGDCTVGAVTVANGRSALFYFTAAATAAKGCASETRACAAGKLSGTAGFAACTPEPAGGIELISDVGVKTGFRETDACASLNDQPFAGGCAKPGMRDVANPFAPAGQVPLWTLQQWGSRSSAPGGAGEAYGDGRKWGNADKHIALFPSGIVEMGVNGQSDFGGVYRQASGRPGWPSLYLGFGITAPVAEPLGSGPISTMKNLFFNMDARLANTNRHEQAGYDPNQNAIIFVVYFGLQQLNMKAAGYGEYVWFGVPVYNDLEASPAAYAAADTFGDGLGTGMFIYSIPYSQVAATSVQSGQWVTMSTDLLPQAKTAIAQGAARGYLKNSNLADYRVSGMVVGFEVTGLNETWVQFRTPSLKVKH